MEINTSDAEPGEGHRAEDLGAADGDGAEARVARGAVNGGKPICSQPDWARMLAFIFQNKGVARERPSPAVATAVNFYVGLIKQGPRRVAGQARRRLVR